ncbi:hypothetical protein BD413DRAFT_318290 [Trametes elegans]|nr:hypothetical protein BD413DRAFT_318290 [Trametes elegans]
MSRITLPKENDEWIIGEKRTIVWDTEGIPPNTTITGDIVLGYLQGNTNDKHFNYDNPIAKNVPITAGSVTVTVPVVEAHGTYVIEAFGDPESISPRFIIKPA